MTRRLLTPEWFGRPSLEVGPELLGAVVEHTTADGTVAIRLTEVEAYDGVNDPGSHAYRGPTPRNQVMFGPPGFVYVYFTYGMHFCMNLVCRPAGAASAVLLRAGEVVAGAELAVRRRPAARRAIDLARGPARLTTALGIDGSCNGLTCCDPAGALRVYAGTTPVGDRLAVGPRVGLRAAADRPWRFSLAGEPTVSTYRPAGERRRRGRPSVAS